MTVVSERVPQVLESYFVPKINVAYPEFIQDREWDPAGGSESISWQFENQAKVTLRFYSEDTAKIQSMPASLVLPEEGEDGWFYTAQEIHLFLTKIKRSFC
ncbi:hypothetical protein [Aneurinibacillus terranovensis]|uniref:hypothetical protein n=1 Tax=Aneurinibacillus terranovensis TaxID=278991 RepID=UPI0004006970|nr:hypothetical protein [Aneurinibacillus terranovensis]